MMQLYSGTTCPFSHRCRFVLYEKGMDFQVIDVDLYNKPEDIARMIDIGVDGVISDHPDVLRKIAAEKGIALPSGHPVSP